MTKNEQVEIFFDPDTFTATYLLWNQETKDCVAIDTVLDIDLAEGKISTHSADQLLSFIDQHGLKLHYVLETHVHADHLSAAAYIKEKTGAKIAISEKISEIQAVFVPIYNLDTQFDNQQLFDQLLSDGDLIKAGSIHLKALLTPGHTPACMTYYTDGHAFCGDTVFMPDFGTARCDFPGGDAATLYQSIERILSLPKDTKIYVGHDYAPNGRDYKFVTTVEEQQKQNIHIGTGKSKDDFINDRTIKDKTLSAPRLLLPSIQVNIRGGQLPIAEDNGKSYLKIPIS